MNAARIVYQFSILAMAVQITQVPYNASIISYEKMSFYAYISIADVFLKLLNAFMLLYVAIDKLKLYSVNILTKESSVLCVFDEINMCSYKICIDTRGYFELVYIQDYYKDILENSPNQKVTFCLNNRNY